MKLAKAMSMALACAMAATMCATSAFAATSGSTKVNATVTPSYTLTVPESITLTNAKGGSGTYTGTIPVNVKGDIGEGQSVTVTSTAPIMKCSGSKNVTATFTGRDGSTKTYTLTKDNLQAIRDVLNVYDTLLGSDVSTARVVLRSLVK